MKQKKDEITICSSAAEYLTYVASVGNQQDSVEMRYEDENIWLTQKMMAKLYDVGLPTINEHIKKIYADSELEEAATIRNFRIVQTEGSRQVTRDTKHYNLQMIIAVGFKVNNERAVQFRKWANGIVKDYTIKGWVTDDERLKNGGSVLTIKYFDRLLEQIREIRLSERRFYQKVTDIYATALDYDRTAKTTKQFFAKVQNKMHYAVHGHTAAELIYERTDADKPHMEQSGRIVPYIICGECLHRFVRYARNVMGVTLDGTDEEVAEAGICAMEDFYRSIGMPTNLNELGIHPTDAQIEDMAKWCMIAAGTGTGSAKKMNREDAVRIYQNARGSLPVCQNRG